MNKTKFFSSLLVAVLFATTSVFVSCKDYDDDIKNLQSQIDKAALKADLDALSTKLAGVESTANAAKTTAENALAKANANATEIAAVKATAEKAAADAADALKKVATAQSTAEAAQAAADGAKTLAENAQKAADAAQATANAAATKKDLEDAVAKLEKSVKDLEAVAATKAELADAKKELKDYTDAAKEAALATAKASAEKYLTDAKGYTDAEVAKINDNIKTLATKAYVEKLSKDLNDEITGLKNTLAAITDEEKMAELVKIVGSFDTVVNTLFSAVTSVELIGSYSGNMCGIEVLSNTVNDSTRTKKSTTTTSFNPFEMMMTTGTIAKNSVFGDEHSTFKGETYEFKEGANIDFNSGVVVRVSPVTADLTAANILLVNSKGEGLDDYVEAGTPVRFEETGAVITRGTKIQSGLWYVPFSIKADVKEDDFKKATVLKNKQILYAVAVNNTADSDANRYAVSTYDVDPNYSVYSPVSTFGFTVDRKDVKDIRNRWTGDAQAMAQTHKNDSYSEETKEYGKKYGMDAKELVWIEQTEDRTKKGLIIPATEPGKYDKDGNGLTRLAKVADNEARYNQPMVPVEIAKPFTVAMYKGADAKIQYYYVTLDEREFAVESDPSEWVAWNSYYPNIENLNKLIPAGESLDITINDAKANGDIVGFRVYAVNYDGTLVDPDGRAFYVQVGVPGQTASTVATYIATVADIDGFDNIETAIADGLENKSNKAGNASFTAEFKDKTYTGQEMKIYYNNSLISDAFAATGTVTIPTDKGGNNLKNNLTVKYTLLKANGKEAATKWSEVAGAAIVVKNAKDQVDGSTVNFTLEAKDATSGRVINSLTIGVKKQLPSAEYAIEWRATLEPVDGVLTVYPSPSAANYTYANGAQTITNGNGNINPKENKAISWPAANVLSGAAVVSAIVDLGGYANGLKAGTFDWIVKKVVKDSSTGIQANDDDYKGKAFDKDVTIAGEAPANATDFDHFVLDIDKNLIGQSFDSEIYAVYKGISLAKKDANYADYTITAWTGKVKFASVFQDLVEYGNAAYDCWPRAANATAQDPGHVTGNPNNFMRNDYYYFYAASEVGNIWQKLDKTTVDGDGTNAKKYKTLSNLDLNYWALTGTVANTAVAVGDVEEKYKLNALFSADWKGANAQEKLTSRMKAQNAGLVLPQNGSLLDYVTFTKETEVPGGAKTLIKAETTPEETPTYLKITNLPGGTCTSPVEDKINIKATDQFEANKFTMGLNLTIKPSTAAFNYANGL